MIGGPAFLVRHLSTIGSETLGRIRAPVKRAPALLNAPHGAVDIDFTLACFTLPFNI